jgi:Cytochrome C'
MAHIRGGRGLILSALLSVIGALVLLAPTRARPEQLPRAEPKFVPKFEAVAETRLLMEGLAQSNYRSLEKHLQGKGPADGDTWAFARGQAILIAETGNLLLLRPPRNQGRDTWMREAMDMRQSAAALARRLANRDLERSRTALADLAAKCNQCHRSFRVPVQIGPNTEVAPAVPGIKDTE